MKSGQPLLKRIIKIEIKKQNKNWRVTKESKIENKKEKFEIPLFEILQNKRCHCLLKS